MTKDKDLQWLSEIRERFQKSTQGKWLRNPNKKYWVLLPIPEGCPNLNDENDAQFAANAHQDIPTLLAYIDVLREALEGIRDTCGTVDLGSFTQIKEAVTGAVELSDEALTWTPEEGVIA